MQMGPWMVTVGSMIAFFTVVAMVVVLPTTSFEPKPSDTSRELTAQEMRGRNLFLANGCIYCHSGFVRPQDVFAGQFYLYPRVAEPGDYTIKGETPNLFGTVRTGPDLSQGGGFHPDDWHYAHYTNPRYTVPFSIMPRFSFLSEREAADLVAFTQSRGGTLADFRTQHQVNMKALIIAAGNVSDPNQSVNGVDQYPAVADVMGLSYIERGYWFSDNPLPITDQNLIRGRQVFEQRCIGCHGSQGDGKGPAAFYLNPPPADFTTAVDQVGGVDTAPGVYYQRVLRGIPGTGMENFGTQLSVDDIWRVVMFLKTIANGGLDAVPTTDMYIQWIGYPAVFDFAECFETDKVHFEDIVPQPVGTAEVAADPTSGAPAGVGDVVGLYGSDRVNPIYALLLWMLENGATPCATEGYKNVDLRQIIAEAELRTDGYARNGTDQVQFIPPSLLDTTQLPPALLSSVWGKPNPGVGPGSGNG
jgi:cbb3-type cytochrome c oxidase subunit II